MLRATDADKAWAVTPGNDSVFILEDSHGGCSVTALGPPLAKTFAMAETVLTAPPLRMSEGPRRNMQSSIVLHFEKVVGSEGVAVDIAGSEPGMPDHRSTVSSILATVSRAHLRPAPAA